MSTVIIARSFAGQTLYLTDAPRDTNGRAFCWSFDRSRALPLSAGVAKRIIEEAQDYSANAYAVDTNDNVIVPACSNAAQPAQDGSGAAIACGGATDLYDDEDALQAASDAAVDDAVDAFYTDLERQADAMLSPTPAAERIQGAGPDSDGREEG